jgi:hypothetical protein
MIFDSENLFSDKQAVTVTAASTNIIDLGVAAPGDLGAGRAVSMAIQMTTAATAAGAATVNFQLQVDDNAAFSSPTTVASTGAIGKATLVAGYNVALQYVPLHTNERYFRINYVVATGPLTAGNIMAGIVCSLQTNNT